jgi:hypothetical protein
VLSVWCIARSACILNLEQSQIWECLPPFGPEFYIFLFVMESTMQIIILPVVSYGCITWFLMLREQHGLRVIYLCSVSIYRQTQLVQYSGVLYCISSDMFRPHCLAIFRLSQRICPSILLYITYMLHLYLYYN